MSKYLRAIKNETKNATLQFVFSRDFRNPLDRAELWILPQGDKRGDPLPEDVPIPDNSDPSKYFDTQHIELNIYDANQKLLKQFNFWDNDWKNYQIEYSEGRPAPNQPPLLMTGGAQGGNRSPVVLHVSQPTPGRFHLVAITLIDTEVVTEMGRKFSNFMNTAGIRPGEKYSRDQMRKFMKHDAFQVLKANAEENRYQSLALVQGLTGSIVVGAEFMAGILAGARDPGIQYLLTSTAVSFGTDEGVGGFFGYYLTTEEAAEVSGHEFYYELSIAFGLIGFGVRHFTTFSGASGMLFMATSGEEVEFGIGIGDTTTSQLPPEKS